MTLKWAGLSNEESGTGGESGATLFFDIFSFLLKSRVFPLSFISFFQQVEALGSFVPWIFKVEGKR